MFSTAGRIVSENRVAATSAAMVVDMSPTAAPIPRSVSTVHIAHAAVQPIINTHAAAVRPRMLR